MLVLLRFLALLAAFRRLGGSLPLACAGVVVALIASTGHIAVARPQVAGELGFACLLLALSRPAPSRRATWAVPTLFVVWANVHGSFAVGLIVLAACLAGRAIEVYQAAPARDPRTVLADDRVRRLLGILLASAAAIACLNPHGPFLYWYTVQLGRHPNMASLTEWNPVGLRPGWGWHWHYFFLPGLVAGTRLLSPRRSSPTEVLLMGFAVLPCFQQRWMVWWIMLAPWLMLPHWAAIAARPPWCWLARRGEPSRLKALLAAQVLIALALFSTPGRWLLLRRPESLERAVSFDTPWRLAETLRDPTGPATARWPELARAAGVLPRGQKPQWG